LTPERASIIDFKPPDLAGKLRDVDVTVGAELTSCLAAARIIECPC